MILLLVDWGSQCISFQQGRTVRILAFSHSIDQPNTLSPSVLDTPQTGRGCMPDCVAPRIWIGCDRNLQSTSPNSGTGERCAHGFCDRPGAASDTKHGRPVTKSNISSRDNPVFGIPSLLSPRSLGTSQRRVRFISTPQSRFNFTLIGNHHGTQYFRKTERSTIC